MYVHDVILSAINGLLSYKEDIIKFGDLEKTKFSVIKKQKPFDSFALIVRR